MFQGQPRVIGGTGRRSALAVLLETRRVDVVDREMIQNPAVGRFLGLIGQHTADFLGVAEIIALEVAAVSALDRVLADVYGVLAPVRPGNLNDEDRFLAGRHEPDLIVGE